MEYKEILDTWKHSFFQCLKFFLSQIFLQWVKIEISYSVGMLIILALKVSFLLQWTEFDSDFRILQFESNGFMLQSM